MIRKVGVVSDEVCFIFKNSVQLLLNILDHSACEEAPLLLFVDKELGTVTRLRYI